MQAQRGWWERALERQVGPYWLKTDLAAPESGPLAAHLLLMHREYAARLAFVPARAPAPMNVMVFSQRQEYNRTLELRFGLEAAGTGGLFFVTPSASALALWTEGLSRRRVHHVLQHEGFHQFAYSRFGGDLPMWVNEGLAEYFGQAVPVGGRLLAGQLTPRTIERVREAIELERTVPFARMLAMDGREWVKALAREGAGDLYHQARAMVQFLIEADGGRYLTSFATWLKMLNAGYPADHAFRRSFGTDDIERFEQRWKTWMLDARPGAFVTALERIEFLAEGIAELSRRGVAPASLDDLRAQLQAIGFTTTLTTHALEVELAAADDRMYTIPRDGLCEADPVFEIRPPERRPGQPPGPPALRTRHLGPRTLEVRWQRDEVTGEPAYHITW